MDNSVFYSNDAEMGVLGSVLRSDKAARIAYDMLPLEAFYNAANREVYAAMQTIIATSRPVDFITLDEELTRRGKLEAVGGAAYLVELSRNVPSAANVKAYIRIVDEKYIMRRLAETSEKIFQLCHAGDADVPELLADAEKWISDIALHKDSDSQLSLQTVLINAFDELERRAKGEEKGLPFGIASLDKHTAGLHKGEMTIIGARPGVGKSALAAQIALSSAKAGAKVCICSREMTDIQYGIRVLMRGTNVDSAHLRSGDLTDNDWAQLSDSMMLYGNHDIRFLFDIKHVEDLRQEVQRMKEHGGLDMLVVDYVQLMQTRQRCEKDYMRIAIVSKALKDMSVDFDISVVALAQVGRSSEGEMPALSELRGSGDLEQDADNVIFMHRPKNAEDDWVHPDDKAMFPSLESRGAHYIVLNIAKQRQGETKAVSIAFTPGSMQFQSILRQ